VVVSEDAPKALRDAIVQADAESRRLRHGYIGSEHLLLGLLRTTGTHAEARLAKAGIRHAEVASFVVRIVGVGEEVPGTKQLPITPHVAAVLRRVMGEGERDGPEAIGSEHVLRALLRIRESVAVRMLEDLGADPSAIADELRRPRPDD